MRQGITTLPQHPHGPVEREEDAHIAQEEMIKKCALCASNVMSLFAQITARYCVRTAIRIRLVQHFTQVCFWSIITNI